MYTSPILKFIFKKTRKAKYSALQDIMNEGRGRSVLSVAREIAPDQSTNAITHILVTKLKLTRYTRWIDETKEKLVIIPLAEGEKE